MSLTGRKKLAHGKGTRWCKRCGSFSGLICAYDLMLCRNVLGKSQFHWDLGSTNRWL